jgi:hypothetical protein
MPKVLAAAAEVGAGAGYVDEALVEHFRRRLEERHGQGSCSSSSKSRARLLKASQRLKHMLSTVDFSKVTVDGLLPGALSSCVCPLGCWNAYVCVCVCARAAARQAVCAGRRVAAICSCARGHADQDSLSGVEVEWVFVAYRT